MDSSKSITKMDLIEKHNGIMKSTVIIESSSRHALGNLVKNRIHLGGSVRYRSISPSSVEFSFDCVFDYLVFTNVLVPKLPEIIVISSRLYQSDGMVSKPLDNSTCGTTKKNSQGSIHCPYCFPMSQIRQENEYACDQDYMIHVEDNHIDITGNCSYCGLKHIDLEDQRKNCMLLKKIKRHDVPRWYCVIERCGRTFNRVEDFKNHLYKSHVKCESCLKKKINPVTHYPCKSKKGKYKEVNDLVLLEEMSVRDIVGNSATSLIQQEDKKIEQICSVDQMDEFIEQNSGPVSSKEMLVDNKTGKAVKIDTSIVDRELFPESGVFGDSNFSFDQLTNTITYYLRNIESTCPKFGLNSWTDHHSFDRFIEYSFSFLIVLLFIFIFWQLNALGYFSFRSCVSNTKLKHFVIQFIKSIAYAISCWLFPVVLSFRVDFYACSHLIKLVIILIEMTLSMLSLFSIHNFLFVLPLESGYTCTYDPNRFEQVFRLIIFLILSLGFWLKMIKFSCRFNAQDYYFKLVLQVPEGAYVNLAGDGRPTDSMYNKSKMSNTHAYFKVFLAPTLIQTILSRIVNPDLINRVFPKLFHRDGVIYSGQVSWNLVSELMCPRFAKPHHNIDDLTVLWRTRLSNDTYNNIHRSSDTISPYSHYILTVVGFIYLATTEKFKVKRLRVDRILPELLEGGSKFKGYGVPQAKLKDVIVDESFDIRFLDKSGRDETVQFSPFQTSFALPKPNPHDTELIAKSMVRRIGASVGEPSFEVMNKFHSFVTQYVETVYESVIDVGEVFDCDEWLARTNYNEARKQDLRLINNQVAQFGIPPKDVRTTNSFIKDETYTKFKPARWINSRPDTIKVILGPVFKKIEDKVYLNSHYVKHMSIEQRCNAVRDRFNRPGCCYSTDFSSFECSFTRELMSACELVLYKHMLQHHPQKYELIEDVIGGMNVMNSKYVKGCVSAKRMSGEMCTSLGNTFANEMIIKFICAVNDVELIDYLVEGDDSLFLVDKPLNDISVFSSLGLDVKIVLEESALTASFCGVVCDGEGSSIMTNPAEALIDVLNMSSKYKDCRVTKQLALIKCKLLSCLYQYNGCPIIAPLCFKMLLELRHIDIRSVDKHRYTLDTYMYEEFLKARTNFENCGGYREPTTLSRASFQIKYGISPEDQVLIENMSFNSCIEVLSAMEEITNRDVVDYSLMFRA